MTNKCPDKKTLQGSNPLFILAIALALVGALFSAAQMTWSTALFTDNDWWIVIIFFLSALGLIAFTIWFLYDNFLCKEEMVEEKPMPAPTA